MQDTGSVIDTEDTDTTGNDVPSYPFRDVLKACMSLDESGCPVDLNEGAQVEQCVAEANAQIASMIEQVLSAAQEATGDPYITLEDIANGRVPATVTASYDYGTSGLNGQQVQSEYSWLAISFGDNREEHEDDLWDPYETTSMTTLRCTAYNIAPLYDTETIGDFYVQSFIKPQNEVQSSASMSIVDFSVDGESTGLEIYGTQYDIGDTSLYTQPSFCELGEASEKITDAALTLTGESGHETTIFYQ